MSVNGCWDIDLGSFQCSFDTVATGISGRFSWGLEMVCWAGDG
jgi:hypothetical protein